MIPPKKHWHCMPQIVKLLLFFNNNKIEKFGQKIHLHLHICWSKTLIWNFSKFKWWSPSSRWNSQLFYNIHHDHAQNFSKISILKNWSHYVWSSLFQNSWLMKIMAQHCEDLVYTDCVANMNVKLPNLIKIMLKLYKRKRKIRWQNNNNKNNCILYNENNRWKWNSSFFLSRFFPLFLRKKGKWTK